MVVMNLLCQSYFQPFKNYSPPPPFLVLWIKPHKLMAFLGKCPAAEIKIYSLQIKCQSLSRQIHLKARLHFYYFEVMCIFSVREEQA
jgi:hypothetical protein